MSVLSPITIRPLPVEYLTAIERSCCLCVRSAYYIGFECSSAYRQKRPKRPQTSMPLWAKATVCLSTIHSGQNRTNPLNLLGRIANATEERASFNNFRLEAMFLVAGFALVVQFAQILFLTDNLHPTSICRCKKQKNVLDVH